MSPTIVSHPTPGRVAPLLRCLLALLVLVLVVATPTTSTASDTTGASPDESGAETDYGRMLLLLDSSGSMAEPAGDGGTKIEAARQALGDVVDNLPDEAFVGLRVYGATVFSRTQPGACTDTQLVVPPGTDNRDELRAAVADYAPYGETPIGYSLRQAARDIGAEGTRSVVLVSDGVATCEPDPCDVARELADRGIDLQIDVVGLSVDARARAQLRCIAAEGNGTYYDADSAADIVEGLTTASERALRPFEIDGTPVDGGPDVAAAVELEPARYADRIRAGSEEKWYRYERRMPGSTVVVSHYEQRPGLFSDISLAITSEDGDPCLGGPTPLFHEVFTGYAQTIGGADPEDSCATQPLLFKVTTTGTEGSTDFGVAVVEEPPVENEASLPAPADGGDFVMPRPAGQAEETTPGSSFGDATLLAPGGTYTTSIVPGEVQAFRVPVGWGQQLAVRVDRPGLTAAQAEQVSEGFDYFDLQVLNPDRASVDDRPTGAEDAGVQRAADGPTRQVAGTLPVRWRNRDGRSAAYTAGDYYVVYSAGFETDRSVELPYRLTVAVTGEESGVPTYADGQAVLGRGEPVDAETDTGSEDPGQDSGQESGQESDADSGAEPAASPDDGLPQPVRVGGIVLLALVAAGCVLLAARLVRRSS